MDSVETLKNNLINSIVATQNEKLLTTIASIFEIAKMNEKISFTQDQLEMLKMSEEDIKNGYVYSEEEIDKLDAEWMN